MPATDERAVGEIDVVRGGLQQMGGDQLALGDDLVGGAVERRAADRNRARAEGAGAVRDGIGVALDDLDLLDRDAQLRRQDLREGRGVALAVIVGAEHGAHGAVGLDADRGRLVEADARAAPPAKREGATPDDLDVAGHADAASRPRRSAAALLGETVVVGDRERAGEDLREVAAVVGRTDRRLVRHGARRDEVAPPDLGAIDAEFAAAWSASRSST